MNEDGGKTTTIEQQRQQQQQQQQQHQRKQRQCTRNILYVCRLERKIKHAHTHARTAAHTHTLINKQTRVVTKL